MTNEQEKTTGRGLIAVAAGATSIVWLVAALIVTHASNHRPQAELATILFGTGTVALFVISLVVAILAIFGWQAVRSEIRRRTRSLVKKQMASIELEMRGRISSALGYMLGEMSREPHAMEPRKKDRDRMVKAVSLCREGYRTLENVGGAAKYMGLNNLVFYSSMLGEDSPDYILNKAVELRRAGLEHNVPNLILTYCRAVIRYGAHRPEEIKIARDLALRISRQSRNLDHQSEARKYLKILATVESTTDALQNESTALEGT